MISSPLEKLTESILDNMGREVVKMARVGMSAEAMVRILANTIRALTTPELPVSKDDVDLAEVIALSALIEYVQDAERKKGGDNDR